MFLFLFLSSLSMMKFCVFSGSMIRLGIVLLGPNSQALGPGHAVAEKHLGGFPLRRGFLYQGFLLLRTGAAGIHQQLSPRLKRKHPFLLLLLFLLSSYLTVRNNTYSHCACMPPPPLDALLPIMSLCFLSFCCCRSFPPPDWTSQTDRLKACCVHIIFSLPAQMQMTVTVYCDRQILTFAQCVCFGNPLKQD